MSDVPLDLSALLNKELTDPTGIPWPKRGEVYEVLVAIRPGKTGIVVDGPKEILTFCSEVDYDLESISDITLDTPGIYKAKFKYWATEQYLYGSGETEFEDGFTVVELTKVAL